MGGIGSGRNKTVGRALPPGVVEHKRGRSRLGEVRSYYFYQTFDSDGKRVQISLGSDLAEVPRKWAELQGRKVPRDARTMGVVFDRYERDVIPTKAQRTQKGNLYELSFLRKAFAHVAVDAITPHHIAQYRDARGAPVRANRELALFSHAFNKAREWGLTAKENPCRGVKKHSEKPREYFADDRTWDAMLAHSSPELRFALELAYLTGQRPADIFAMRWSDLREGFVWVKQAKTGKMLKIVIEGRLAALLDEIRATIPNRKNQLSPFVIAADSGSKLTETMYRKRLMAAREAATKAHPDLAESVQKFQFRDARPKAASDLELAQAQALLGHANASITKRVYQRGGQVVRPVK
jgi:integrase